MQNFIDMSRKIRNRPCPVIGVKKQLSEIVLPTVKDVLQHFIYIREESASTFTMSDKNVFKKVSKDVKLIWQKASIPSVTIIRIETLLNGFINSYRKLKKIMCGIIKS